MFQIDQDPLPDQHCSLCGQFSRLISAHLGVCGLCIRENPKMAGEFVKKAHAHAKQHFDLPTFPPFALFDPAMGMTTVVPYMDPTRPAKADPEILVDTINRYRVSNVFGSPALLNVLGRYTEAKDIRLPSVKRVISAGAAMPLATIRRMQKTLPSDAEVYTPYGATECLPVASVSGSDLDAEVEQYKCADNVQMDHYVEVVSRRSEVEARISEKKRGKQPGLTEGIMGGGLVVAKSLKHIPGV